MNPFSWAPSNKLRLDSAVPSNPDWEYTGVLYSLKMWQKFTSLWVPVKKSAKFFYSGSSHWERQLLEGASCRTNEAPQRRAGFSDRPEFLKGQGKQAGTVDFRTSVCAPEALLFASPFRHADHHFPHRTIHKFPDKCLWTWFLLFIERALHATLPENCASFRDSRDVTSPRNLSTILNS